MFSTAAQAGRGCCVDHKRDSGNLNKVDEKEQRKYSIENESRDFLLESEQLEAYVIARILILQLEGGGDLVQFSKVFNLGKSVLFLKC